MTTRSFVATAALGLGVILLCMSIPATPAEAGKKRVFGGATVSQSGEEGRNGKVVVRKKSGGFAKVLIKCKKCENRKIRGVLSKTGKGMFIGTVTMGGSECTATLSIFAGGIVDAFGDCGGGNVFSVYRSTGGATD